MPYYVSASKTMRSEKKRVTRWEHRQERERATIKAKHKTTRNVHPFFRIPKISKVLTVSAEIPALPTIDESKLSLDVEIVDMSVTSQDGTKFIVRLA